MFDEDCVGLGINLLAVTASKLIHSVTVAASHVLPGVRGRHKFLLSCRVRGSFQIFSLSGLIRIADVLLDLLAHV